MYKLFIADDEVPIRDGLKCIMDWEAAGFQICGETGNGEDALSQILRLKPHAILMDIRMPRITGLEVVKRCREQGFTGRFIILSGYSDFKYAQDAIRYGVENYLTKPIDEDELSAAVTKIKASLDKESLNSGNVERLKRKAKDVILHELVTTPADAMEPVSDREIADMELDADVYQVLLYEGFNQKPGTAPYSFAELLKVTNKGNHTFNHIKEGSQDVILLKGTYAINRFKDFLAHYESSTPPQKGSPLDSLFLAYGRPVFSLFDIHLSYADAAALVQRRFFCLQGQHTLSYEDLPEAGNDMPRLLPEKLQEYTDYLVGYLQTFNRKNVAETLFGLEQYLIDAGNPISEIKLFLTDLYLRIKEKICLVYNNTEIPFPTNSTVIDFMDKKQYMYEIIQFLSEQFEMIMNATGNPSRNTVLDDILYYIDHNYQSNIKLETIAPLFGYNSAYLGKLFNKAVGKSFNSYVDYMRIEHSKELLLSNGYKVYEVAEKVGYRNVDYFHKKFRKYVGESPAEFRRKHE